MGYEFSVTDTRTKGAPLVVNVERLQDIATLIGFPQDINGDITLEIRVCDFPEDDTEHQEGESGVDGEVSDEKMQFFVAVYVTPKTEYSEKAMYQVNRILVHEMRHIAQILSGIPPIPMLRIATERDAINFGRLAHRDQFCAIQKPQAMSGILYQCAVCGTVESNTLEDGKQTYTHANASCSGEVTMLMELS